MAFYDNDSSWPSPGRQASWEQQGAPARSGTGSSHISQPDPYAFAFQFEEIERATDNLMKSGRWFPGQPQPMGGMPGRRENIQSAGRGYDYASDPRMGGGSSRNASVSEFEGGRPGSAGLQGFYRGQRHPGGRQSEAEQMLQAKRRMAAQRERELRNYHQEQQYNRTSISGGKSDRSMSPSTMSEGHRRELLAKQHRALYGDNSLLYGSDVSPDSKPQSQDVRVSGPGRGSSPLAFDPYSAQSPSGGEGGVQMPPRDRVGSTASPTANAALGQQQQTPSQQQPQQQQQYSLLNEQSSRTSNSSPGASPPPGSGATKGNGGGVGLGVAPIGTRPVPTSNTSKRSTTPLTPSSLSYGLSATIDSAKDDRSTSAASNPPATEKGVAGLGGWGGNNAAWGAAKGAMAVQPSVWG